MLVHLFSAFICVYFLTLAIVFQVLNIPTKINKGTVEIITPVELIKKGEKVGSSESALLAKLGIRPFSYGLVVTNVYDGGSVFSPEVLDLTDDDLVEKFASGVSMVASLSLALSYPTLAAAPHMFINGYKNVLAVAVETDYSYPHADEIKEYLKVNSHVYCSCSSYAGCSAF
jgi:large subunit ribosomal protein LP0